MLLSNVWSPNPKNGIPSALWCLSAVLLTFLTLRNANQVANTTRLIIAKAFLIGCLVSLGLLLFEAITGMAARRWVMSLVPRLAPTLPGVETERGWITSVPFHLIKKNAAIAILIFWPALLIAVRLATSVVHRMAIAVATLLFVFALLIADHDTSKVALAFSAGFWGLAWLKPKTVKPAAIVLWCSATLAIVPLTLAAFHAELHKADYLKYSARHRITIWGYTADLVLRKPIIGAGVAATRYIDEQASEPNLVAGTDRPSGTNIHSHNAFLQTWHELGAVGAVLLCLAGISTINLIGRQSQSDQAYLFASFSTVAVTASLSWSLLAAWFIAAFSLTAIFAQLACQLSRDNVQKADGSPSPPDRHEEMPDEPIIAACPGPVSGQRG